MVRIERVLAPNPGPFTGPGTNTWLLESSGDLVVIDPGPLLPEHLQAIINALRGRSVRAIMVTHTHPDHAPLANPLAREVSAPVYGFQPGPQFEPDALIGDGWLMTVGEVGLRAIHTPGHSSDHVCLLAGRTLFTGDHIMGGSSVMIEDLRRYLESLERLQTLDLDRLYPGHGEVMDRPQEVVSWYLAHRRQREQEILAALGGGAVTIEGIVEVVYDDVDRSLHPLAARSVLAHLQKLEAEGSLRLEGNRVHLLTPLKPRGPVGDTGPRVVGAPLGEPEPRSRS